CFCPCCFRNRPGYFTDFCLLWCTGDKKGAEPDDAELLSLSKKLVETAVLKAVQQYLEETQNKNIQNDCGTPVKTEKVAIGNSKESESDISRK
uniref:A-kinase anchor protein 7 RI-RII subunit-binding domain-containing protein n=1 Tax=Laticauda laticaudata TaxID=8630 RepID=A0A8C5RW11_LATLA